MSVTLSELLMPQVILELVSRIREGQGALGRWLGFQPNRYDAKNVTLSGPATVRGPTRYPNFRIFDRTRVVAKATAPGTGPVTVAQNPMGNVQIECARWHMKIPLNYEFLSNLTPMIGPNSVIDEGGQSYIDQMIRFMGEQNNNMVEMSAAGMMRDSLYFIQSGQSWLPSFTAPTGTQVGFQVNFQIPAGNKSQGNMLGTGDIITISWANPSAPIVKNCLAIAAAFTQLTNFPLTDVWVNSTTWYSVITNTEVRNVGGTVQSPFAEYDRDPERGMDGEEMSGHYTAKLRAIPWLTWHIDDDVVALNTDVDPSYATAPSGATLGKLIPDGKTIFCTKASPRWTKLYLGGEYVVENPGQPGILRQGHYFWKEYVTQPSGVDLISLLNEVPLLYVPKAIAPLDAIFP